jgi:hypothetical protein
MASARKYSAAFGLIALIKKNTGVRRLKPGTEMDD